MNIQAVTPFRAVAAISEQARCEARSFERRTVNVTKLRSGDVLVSSGQVVNAMFDHVFDQEGTGNDWELRGDTATSVLVWFTQVTGLTVVHGTHTGISGRKDCVEIFRPIQDEDGS